MFCIFCNKGVVQFFYKFTGFYADFFFPADFFAGAVCKEFQAIVFFFKVFQFKNFRLVFRAVHIVNADFCKIGNDYPSWAQIVGKFRSVSFCLLIRCEHCAVGLGVRFFKVDVYRFLFYKDFCFGNIAVNKTCVGKFYPLFKFNIRCCLRNAQNICQKPNPKTLGFLFFVSPVFPFFAEFFCCCLLFCLCHGFILAYFLKCFLIVVMWFPR